MMFLGSPGAGKGEQIRKLRDQIKRSGQVCRIVETGKYLREKTKSAAPFASGIAQMIKQGELAPRALPLSVLTEVLFAASESDTIITDGIGRRMSEMRMAIELFQVIPEKQITILFLQVSESVIRERMEKRGRKDDTHTAIKQRLESYRTQTLPTAAYIRKLAEVENNISIHTIDGEGSIQQVHERVLRVLAMPCNSAESIKVS